MYILNYCCFSIDTTLQSNSKRFKYLEYWWPLVTSCYSSPNVQVLHGTMGPLCTYLSNSFFLYSGTKAQLTDFVGAAEHKPKTSPRKQKSNNKDCSGSF